MKSSPLHEVRGEVAAFSPRVFLNSCAQNARGFWASGDRWIAHAGLVGRIAVERDCVDPDASRFRAVQKASAELFGRLSGAQAPPRVFGGFAFAAPGRAAAARPPSHAAESLSDTTRTPPDPIWSAFPSALFHLPEVEAEHHPATGACSLIVRAATRRDAHASWRRWARALERARASEQAAALDRAPALERTPNSGFGSLGIGAGKARRPDFGGGFRLGSRAAWGRMVWQALNRIGTGEAEKVVLARTLDVNKAPPVGPADLAIALWEENHGSHAFLFEPAPGQAVVGAAPEIVATLFDGVVRATAVAGSAPVGKDSVETAQLARALFDSDKDRAEHDFVVRDIVERLGALGCRVQRDIEPHVLALARIQHLETKIAAKAPSGLSLLEILDSLHPTPAVCGIPREVALSVIASGEAFDRGWYAGPVGWFDASGAGMFVPALRSAVRSHDRWRLFAGAGIVRRSDPALEWDETELKLRPVLRAIARARVREGAAAGTAAGTG